MMMHMKRINPDTGKRFVNGYIRENGYKSQGGSLTTKGERSNRARSFFIYLNGYC